MNYAKKEISIFRYCFYSHDLRGIGVGFHIEEETGGNGNNVDAGEFTTSVGVTAGYFRDRGGK